MTKYYTLSTGETIVADVEQLEKMLSESRTCLENYREVLSSLDDDDDVARGNGFCESRYSSDFIESQVDKYGQRIRELERIIDDCQQNK